MKGRRWLLSGLAAAAFAVGGLLSPAAAQDLAKCQKQLENNARGFKDQVFKALQTCKDLYRTEVVKAQTLNLTPAQLATNLDKKAVVCGKKLDGVLGTKGGGLGTATPKTQAEKYYKKLNDLLVTNKCTSDHLAQLGHLPSAQFGDAWIRSFLVAQLKWAYEQQLSVVPDLPSILNQLIDPDTALAGSCAIAPPAGDGNNYCAVLASPPCTALNCRIDSVNTSLTINLCGLGPVPAPLSGEVVQEYCQFPPWTGCDLAIVGAPARSIDPVNFVGNNACTTSVRSEGWVKGAASCTIGYGGPNGSPVTTFNVSSVVSGPKDITICQDVDPTTGSSCAPGTLVLPAASTPCGCSGAPAGPINVTFAGSLGAGDSITSAALQIHTVNPATANCSGTTSDATFVPLFFTTGSVSITVEDADSGTAPCAGDADCSGSDTLSLSQTGAPITGAAPNTNDSNVLASNFLDSSDLATATTAGGFPGACSATLPSLATVFKIVCQ
ncbi:MAG: hypothetical protein KatS3mg077_0812 [Candidatus Binatia bacterium]|nr:MAG: hypothetical protein KatS3mg077_0812 [Candidatus Binatia bacterium]